MNLKGNYLEVTILGVEGNDFATWLEHELNIRAWKPADCFSTLYRVEGCAAQPATVAAPSAVECCFSTLYRVEGCAALYCGGTIPSRGGAVARLSPPPCDPSDARAPQPARASGV